MEQILAKWNAGSVRRWHCNADLCATVDPTDGHSARVAKLALMLKPDLSRDAIIFALAHDDGEVNLGDVSGLWKRQNPDLATALRSAEAENLKQMGINLPDLSQDESAVIDLCDKIDAYLWMMKHAQHLSKTDDWRASKGNIHSILGQLMNNRHIDASVQAWAVLEYFS